jgi:hypothetical protein
MLGSSPSDVYRELCEPSTRTATMQTRQVCRQLEEWSEEKECSPLNLRATSTRLAALRALTALLGAPRNVDLRQARLEDKKTRSPLTHHATAYLLSEHVHSLKEGTMASESAVIVGTASRCAPYRFAYAVPSSRIGL